MFPFGRSSEVVPIRTQRIPQSIETPVTFVAVPGAYVRYAYSRSSDSMNSRVEGQDYLCFQHNDQRFVAVVCDGVGSSFCGNLAARILGDRLLEWLWTTDITYLNGAAALAEAVSSALNRLQKEARREVEEYQIPGQMSPLVRQALEAQRAYGSEAVFAAVRLDHPSPAIPEGLVSILWMGDTRIHTLDEDGAQLALGGRWDNADRWSTTQGVRGQMSAWMREMEGVGRIVAYTDGLTAHAGGLTGYSDDQLDREIRAGARLPTSDDVALLDVVLRSVRYEGYPDPEVPDLNAERPQLEHIWNPTGTNVYELRWSLAGQPNAGFMLQEATNPALSDARMLNVPAKETSWRPPEPQSPGHYYYRVRAVTRRGTLTPWSELRQVIVPYPPPPAPVLKPVEPGGAPTLMWEGEALDYTLEESGEADFGEPKVVYVGRGNSWTVPASSYQPGTYYYRVQATSDGGASPWSRAQQVEIVIPPPPTPHLAGIGYTHVEGEFELRWQAVPGATRYELEETERESGDTQIVSLTEIAYRVSHLEEGQYVYRVRACHDFGCSEWSNEQAAIIAPRAPAEAPHLTLEGPDETSMIRLAWDEVAGASEYEVEISEEEAFPSARVRSVTECELEIARHEPGQLFFRVRGSNSGSNGPWSNVERLAVEPKTPAWIESEPAGGGKRISLAWGAVGGRITYVLEMSTGGEPGEYVEVYRGEDTHCEVTAGGASAFRVRAEAPGVQSAWQYSDPQRAQSSELAAPVLKPPEIGEEGKARLRWDAVQGAGKYVLEISNDERFSVPKSREMDLTAADFQPPDSGRYWFRVKAQQGARTGPPSNIVSIQVKQPSAPSLWPSGPVRANTPFEITWTGVPGCVYYELQESGSETFDKKFTLRIFHPDQKHPVLGRRPGRYYYRIKAVDDNDQHSAWSEVLSIEVTQ